MTIDESPRRPRGEGLGFAAGIGSVLMIAVLERGLGPAIDDGGLFLLLLAAATAAAWLGGTRAGLATAVFGALAGSVAILPTGDPTLPVDPARAVSLGLLLLVGGLSSVILGSRHRLAGAGLDAPASTAPVEAAAGHPIGRERRAEIATFDQLGLSLSGQLDMETLAKAVTDAGVAMTGAAFGAFLYRDGSGGADALRHRRAGGCVRRLPLVPGHGDVRLAVPGGGLAEPGPRRRPTVRSEPSVQADAVRPRGGPQLPGRARPLQRGRLSRRPVLRPSAPGRVSTRPTSGSSPTWPPTPPSRRTTRTSFARPGTHVRRPRRPTTSRTPSWPRCPTSCARP